MAEVIFWLCAALLAWTYVLYPLVVTALARLRPRPTRSDARPEPTVSLVIPAYNEAAVIAAKIENSLALDYPAEKLEVIVASDGSDDETDASARRFHGKRLRVLAIRPRSGKPTAIDRGVRQSTGEIVLLCDANTLLRKNALRRLVRHFADPVVGAVTGDVRLVDRKHGYGESEGAYYRYERHLQTCESALGSAIGVDGGMYAVRRGAFKPPAPDTILDDFVISMEIAKRGYRIIFEPEAIAEEDAAPDEEQEFRRKTRVAAGAWQCLKRGAGIPTLRTPGLFAMFVSHKLLRWLSPVFLAAMVAASAALAERPLYMGLLGLQAAFCGLAAAGALARRRAGAALALPYYFCFVHLAAAVGLVKGVFGLQSVRWKKVDRTLEAAAEDPVREAAS